MIKTNMIETYFEKIKINEKDQEAMKEEHMDGDWCPFCGHGDYERLTDKLWMFWILIANRCLHCGKSWIVKLGKDGKIIEKRAASLPKGMFEFYKKNYCSKK